jgi:hypothetical protein
MIGFEGRLQWRQHELFKLRAKPLTHRKDMNYIMLEDIPNVLREPRTASKIGDSLNPCAPHNK